MSAASSPPSTSISPGWNASRVEETLGKVYDLEPFVRLLTREGRTVHWPSVLGVRHTNFCDIAFAVSTGHARLVLSSALDNLVKGAAGQAVQCLNAAAGLDETTGLFSRHIEDTTPMPDAPHPAPLVIKVGAPLEDESIANLLAASIAALARRRAEARQGGVILIHGGGKAADRVLEALGFETIRRDGIRVTPRTRCP